MEQEKVNVTRSPTRCPYCHESVVEGKEAQRVCQGCLSRHHEGCWGELDRCASCGCEQALEESAPRESDVRVCRACGVHDPATAFDCPTCAKGVCSPCYSRRFRRCVDCAGELIAAEHLIKKRAQALENHRGGVFFGLLLAVGGFILTGLGFGQVVPYGVAFAVGLGIMAMGVFMLATSARRVSKLAEQVEELELKLAPFPEISFTDRIGEKAKDLFGKLFAPSSPPTSPPSSPPGK